MIIVMNMGQMIFIGELKSIKSTSYILELVSIILSVWVGSNGLAPFLVCMNFT